MAALYILFLTLLFTFSGRINPIIKEWTVTEQSSLTIVGSSNVNQFQCVSLSYAGDDTLLETRDLKENKSRINGLVVLKARGFDCGNPLMTKDLERTIRAEKYPSIKVRFLELERNLASNSPQLVRGTVDVSLVGISRQYEMEAQFIPTSQQKALLKGNFEFSFSDFGLEPPTKLMGAIKVNDCLSIDFKLVLEATSQQQRTSLSVY